MQIIPYNGKSPRIAATAFIAPTAVLVGDVEVGEGASIWYNAVLRADLNAICIGAHSNVQDNCTIHCDETHQTTVGEGVTIGHNSVLHGCTVEGGVVIGMGAIVLNGALVKEGSIVAAGAVVRENQIIGPNQLAAGSPAAVKRELPEDNARNNRVHARTYAMLAADHKAALEDKV